MPQLEPLRLDVSAPDEVAEEVVSASWILGPHPGSLHSAIACEHYQR